MKSEAIADEVKKLEQEERKTVERLDQIVDGGRAEIATRAAAWIDAEVRRCVEANPKEANELGVARMQSFKAQLKQLKADLPAIVDSFARKAPQVHRKPFDPMLDDGYTFNPTRTESFPKRLFRDTISHLGKLLDAFGLLDRGRDSSWQSSGTNAVGGYRYKISTSFEPGTTETWKDYESEAGKLLTTQRLLVKKRAELEKARALELLDSA